MTPGNILARYRLALTQVGEHVIVRRYSGTGAVRTHSDTTARARVVGYAPAQLIGTIVQGDQKVILLAEDLAAGAVTLPLLTSDKLLVRNKELAIVAIDSSTRRIGSVLCAYELQVRG